MSVAAKRICKEYDEKIGKFNKKNILHHTIDIDKCNEMYREFFDDIKNVYVEQDLANESNIVQIESEDIYIDWLKDI